MSKKFPKVPRKGMLVTVPIKGMLVTFMATGKEGFGKWRIVKAVKIRKRR